MESKQEKQMLIEDLIESCSNEIKHNNIRISGKNKAKSPIVFMYLGDKAVQSYPIIKERINDNWNNSNYIFHLNTKYDGKSYKIYDLDTNELIEKKYQDALDDVFTSALSSPMGTFDDNKTVKIECVISCLDSYICELIDIAGNFKTSLSGLSVFKDLYLLIRQGGDYEDRKLTDECIAYFYENENKNEKINDLFKQVYVLSDRMKNGAVLDQFKRTSNYQLIANAVLLTDNDDEGYQSRKEQFYNNKNCYRTMSYRIVQKPCKEIVAVMLNSFLESLINIKAKKKDDIRNMFEEEQFEEEYFEKEIGKCFPISDDFRFLPYTEEGMKNLNNEFKIGNSGEFYPINEDELDKKTFGCFRCFYQENYINKIESAFKTEDFKKSLFEHFAKKYNYRDISEHFRFTDMVEVACEAQEVQIDRRYTRDIFSIMERECYLNARNTYFELIRKPYCETLSALYEDSKRFEEILFEVKNDISGVCVIENSGIYQSIEKYYSEYMENYFESNKDTIMDLFTIKISSYKEMTEALKSMFFKILSDDTEKILTCGFSEELTKRLGVASTPAGRQKLIEDALIPQIDNYMRINVAHDTIKEIYDYYFCNDNPEFLKAINVKTYFDTNDDDCFEHVKIYSFDSIRDVLGGKLEV